MNSRDVAEWIKSLDWTDIRSLIRALFLKQKVALFGCALLLLCSVWFGVRYYTRSTEYEKIVTNTLQADLESTPQRYKGLEAFIMSNVEQGIDADLKKMHLNPLFIAQFAKLKERLDSFDFSKQPELNLHVVPDVDGEMLTDSGSTLSGFLYFPIHLIHTPFSSSDMKILRSADDEGEKNKLDKAQVIAQKIKTEPNLRMDIALTQHLSKTLQDFTRVAITADEASKANKYLERLPPQVYIITKNGINRLFNNQKESPDIYYGRQFTPTIFFPSRPYFWSTLKSTKISMYQRNNAAVNNDFAPKEGQTLENFFYVSRPYMDLGGNGIVITLGRGIVIDGITRAVICFDLPFVKSYGIQPLLKKRMDDFQGKDKSIEVKCQVMPSRGNVSCDPTEMRENELNPIQTSLKNQAVSYIKRKIGRNELSEVFGNMQVTNDPSAEGHLQISVPVAPASYDKDTQTATLLLINLDLADYRSTTLSEGFLAATAFGLMTLWLAYLWGSNSRHKQEYQEALRQVSNVMNEAPIPYVQLNEKDELSNFNSAFCTLLEYPPNKDSRESLTGRVFKSLCADKESEDEYDRVQTKRKNRADVTPYHLRLKTRSSSVAVKVVSADLPSEKRGVLPETFGILLKESREQKGGHSDEVDGEGKVIQMNIK